MLTLLSLLTLAQTIPTSRPSTPPISFPSPTPISPKPIPPQENIPRPERIPTQEVLSRPVEIFQPQEIRPLPGQLDEVPVFNSNSPEVIQTEGILLSTFPPNGMQVPSAHLNFAFKGRFDLFSHHITRAETPDDIRSMFQGVLLYNSSDTPVTVDVLEGASYLTRPDALFLNLPFYVDDPIGTVYAGPGSRVANDILRGRRQGVWPPTFVIPPQTSRMLMNLPIPAGTVSPSSNGRSTLLRMRSTGPIYIANLAMFAPLNPDNTERVPTQEEWEALLVRGGLAGPRDLPPTTPGQTHVRTIYGRVAGVSLGSQWRTEITDNPQVGYLNIPLRGRAFSYGISALYRGTLGTGQVQSAKMLVRYPDTAYQGNGNYGVQYSLTFPLQNLTQQRQTVTLTLQTPIKEDQAKGGLLFFTPPENRVFFRGPLRIRYTDDRGIPKTRFVHVVQERGQKGEPLITLNMPPGDRRLVQVDLVYPSDSTPPQVLTVHTLLKPG